MTIRIHNNNITCPKFHKQLLHQLKRRVDGDGQWRLIHIHGEVEKIGLYGRIIEGRNRRGSIITWPFLGSMEVYRSIRCVLYDICDEKHSGSVLSNQA